MPSHSVTNQTQIGKHNRREIQNKCGLHSDFSEIPLTIHTYTTKETLILHTNPTIEITYSNTTDYKDEVVSAKLYMEDITPDFTSNYLGHIQHTQQNETKHEDIFSVVRKWLYILTNASFTAPDRKHFNVLCRVGSTNVEIYNDQISIRSDQSITHTQYRRCTGIEDAIKFSGEVETIYTISINEFIFHHYLFEQHPTKKVVVQLINGVCNRVEVISNGELFIGNFNKDELYLSQEARYANPAKDCVTYQKCSEEKQVELLTIAI